MLVYLSYSVGVELEQERPGCRCVDSFFLDLSPPRLPRRHRLPDAGFIPNIYNLGDVCEIALDLLKSDLGVMQRSRSYPLSPLSRELITGTEDMVCFIKKIPGETIIETRKYHVFIYLILFNFLFTTETYHKR